MVSLQIIAFVNSINIIKNLTIMKSYLELFGETLHTVLEVKNCPFFDSIKVLPYVPNILDIADVGKMNLTAEQKAVAKECHSAFKISEKDSFAQRMEDNYLFGMPYLIEYCGNLYNTSFWGIYGEDRRTGYTSAFLVQGSDVLLFEPHIYTKHINSFGHYEINDFYAVQYYRLERGVKVVCEREKATHRNFIAVPKTWQNAVKAATGKFIEDMALANLEVATEMLSTAIGLPLVCQSNYKLKYYGGKVTKPAQIQWYYDIDSEAYMVVSYNYKPVYVLSDKNQRLDDYQPKRKGNKQNIGWHCEIKQKNIWR